MKLYKFINNHLKCKNNRVICLTKFNDETLDTIKCKYDHLSTIFDNEVVSNDTKKTMLEFLHKSHKIYFGFLRFYYILLKRKIIQYGIEYDISMNLLSSLKDSCKIKIIENLTEYTFRISDIINIINMSLSYHCNFFPEPKRIKNPYTNNEFCLHTLYIIYYKIKESNYKIPYLFQYYYSCNFDLTKFTVNHENELNDFITNNYTNSLTKDQLFMEIKRMIRRKNNELNIQFYIDPEFPKSKTIEVFKPYFEYYVISKYTLNLFKQSHYENILNKKLLSFYKINRLFGRKKVIIKDNFVYIGDILINSKMKQTIHRDNYIPFHKLDIKTQRHLRDFSDSESDSESANSDTDSDDNSNVTI